MDTPFQAIEESRERIVAEVVAGLYERHPEWTDRWGPGGRESCTRDLNFTLAFLEVSLRSDEPRMFTRYATWLAGLLRSRGVPPDSAKESFRSLGTVLSRALDGREAKRAMSVLEAGGVAIDSVDGSGRARPPLTLTAERLLLALLEPNAADVESILRSALDSGMNLVELADTLIQPAMAEVGLRWEANEITVAKEHRATALAQSVLARIARTPEHEAQKGRIAVACVEGNLHSLGARLVADAFDADGWNVEFLGADVPTRDLVALLKETRFDLLGLSVALPQHLAAARRAVTALRRELGDKCPRILIGGIPVREFPGSEGYVLADAFLNDSASGLRYAEKGPPSGRPEEP